MDRAERVEVGHHRLEDRALALGARGEVLVERHRRRALVRLALATKPPPACGTGPRGHATILAHRNAPGRPGPSGDTLGVIVRWGRALQARPLAAYDPALAGAFRYAAPFALV
jgi:hypothetical protein